MSYIWCVMRFQLGGCCKLASVHFVSDMLWCVINAAIRQGARFKVLVTNMHVGIFDYLALCTDRRVDLMVTQTLRNCSIRPSFRQRFATVAVAEAESEP